MRKGGSEKLGDWLGHTASKLWCWDLDLDPQNYKDCPMKPPDIAILKLWCSNPVAMRQDISSYGPACCWSAISMKGEVAMWSPELGRWWRTEQTKFSTSVRPQYPVLIVIKWWHWFHYIAHTIEHAQEIYCIYFSIGAVTKYHKRGGLKQHLFTTLQFFRLQVL